MTDGAGLARRWVAMFDEHNAADAAAVVADHYVEHAVAPFGQAETGLVDGPSHLRSVVAWLVAQFPDLRMTVELVVATDALAAVLVSSRGTNRGLLNGVIPPTGRAFAARQTHWFRLGNGRLVEHWATRDDLTTMIQLGIVPGPPL